MAQAKLVEVAQLTSDDGNPLDLWGGPTGEELGAGYLSTGGRGGHGASKVFRLRQGDADGAWKDDGVPSGAETMAKIRSSNDRVYAFFETGGGSFIVSRLIDTPGWVFEPISTVDFVGGRGLGIWPDENNVVIGGSEHWNPGSGGERFGKAWRGNHDAGYATHREISPGIAWELEYDEDGLLWEFWHQLPDGETQKGPFAYRDGAVIASPTTDLACAMAFNGQMYCCGDLELRGNWVRRFTGSGWEDVHAFNASTLIDHVCRIPRVDGPPEIWATGQDPFECWRSFDGTTWEEVLVPGGSFPTGTDTNQLTAVGYFDKRVWVAAWDDALHLTRIFVDARTDLLLQII